MSAGGKRAGAGRPLGIAFSENARARIRVTQLISRLQKHAVGLIPMTMSQIRAAEIVLKKALPDLSSIEHTGELKHRHVRELSDVELMAIAAGSGTGTAAEEIGQVEPPDLH